MPRPKTSCRTDKPNVDGLRAGLTIGGALIIMGSGFLLAKLGMLWGLEAWQVWPAILAWMGLLKIFVCRTVRHGIEGVILIAAGGVAGAHYLNVIQLEWGVIWPVLLILGGLIIFMAAVSSSRRKSQKRQSTGGAGERETLSQSRVDGDVTFGSREERIDSQEFEGGEIRCVLGGFKLDLRDARIKGSEAVIRVKAVMGGIELTVPGDWKIVISGNPMMGAFENKTRQRPSAQDPDAPRLVIEGSVVMGGVEIGN
jgi:predicted membrane protein